MAAQSQARPSYRDARGRPLVAVTGLGIVSSLGQGQDANWAALTQGRSGIHAIARFPTDGLRTRIAGTVDFLDTDPLVAPALSERFARVAADEAVTQAGIGAPGDFPGALFIAVPPVEMEWPQRRALAEACARWRARHLCRPAARRPRTRNFDAWHDLFIFGTVADRIADRFGTKGSPISLSTACSSGATAIQLGVEAIRRGEMQAALCIGTDGSVNPESLIRFSLLSALSTQNDPPEAASKPFSKNRDGFVMGEGAARPGAGGRGLGRRARRDDPRLRAGLRREGRRLPSHPLQPGRRADHRGDPREPRRCRRRA